MTATQTAGSLSDIAPVTPPSGVPFSRLLRVELRKLTDTRAGMWLLIVIGAVTAIVVGIMLFAAPADELTFGNLTFATAIPQAVLLPVLGVLAVTSEWSQRTGLVTFTQEPRRLRVAAAKLLAAVLIGLLAVALAFAAGALANLAGMLLRDGDGSWEMSGSLVAGAVLLQLIGVIQGVAFGMAVMNTAAAIVTFFLLPTLWTVLGSMVSWLGDAAEWLDINSTTTPLLEGAMTGSQWARLGTSVLVWVALPLGVGLVRLVRREVK